MPYTTVTPTEFEALEGIGDWRYVCGAIRATFLALSYSGAGDLVLAIANAADAADHHPDIDVRYPGRVRVTLTTHATGGLTTRDTDLATTISALAAQLGATPEPTSAEFVEFAIDTLDADRIRPFWQAVLGYVDVGGTLIDPLRVGPPLWFQTMEVPRTERSRFHVDISVAHDVAEQRVASAVAAGGTLVTDRFARSWWVLADADGNEACICTWQDRSE
jgi:4a-hydroxytetrahydrobiopterin dehydratase